jgi:hypothetical protein
MAILACVSKYAWEKGANTRDIPGELVRHIGGFVVTAVAVVDCLGVANWDGTDG